MDKIKTLKDENEQLKAKIDNLPHVQPGERLCKSYDGHVTFYCMFCISSGKETELFGELSKQITEFLTLKAQFELIEKQRNESHDQETESHDLGVESHDLEIEPHDSVQDQDQTITSGEAPAASCANPSPASAPVIPVTSSHNSSTTGVAEARMANTGHIGGEPSSMDVRTPTEAPPPVSAHQPWPVTSILSQDTTASHCQHATTTNNRIVPTSCHGRSNLTSSGGQNIRNTTAHVSSVSNVSAHVHNISPVSSVSVFHQPDSRVCMTNSSSSSSTHQRSVVTGQHFRAGRSNSTISHSRTGSGLASMHGDYHYHHHNNSSEPQQQVIRYPRERQRDAMGYSGGFSSLNQTRERHHSAMTTQVQPHAGTSAIVQPWVESSHRPRPLHHVTTNTTPMPRISTQAQYNPLQVQQQQHGRNTHPHTERFMPYPCHRMDRHSNSSTFSPGSWSHDNHVITPAGGTSGRHIAPQGRSYASSSHYDLHQHPPLSGGRNGYTPNNYDYSRDNYSTTQGHPSSTQGVGNPSWMPYFTPPSQQNCSRNSSMMSHDSQATPPYPIQPHPHGSGSSSGTSPAVWRPYSERTRSSGFCLADILSLPSETEATPLSLDVTPPTGHHSFLVNRLLDDI